MCLKKVQVFLEAKNDWSTLQEVQIFLASLQPDPSIEPFIQTYLYVPAISRCIIQGDLVCLVKCYNTAWEKLKKLMVTHPQTSQAEIEAMFKKNASKAEQIACGSVSDLVEQTEGKSLQLQELHHPCSADFLPLHLYFIVAALDLITSSVNSSKKGMFLLDQLVHVFRTTTTHASKVFSGKIKADKVKMFVKTYSSLFKLTGSSITLKTNHNQVYQVVEEHFYSGVARLEFLVKKRGPRVISDLHQMVRSEFPKCESSVLEGADMDGFTNSIISQPGSFLITGPNKDLVFLQKDQVGDPLPLIAINKLRGLVKNGCENLKDRQSATYPIGQLVSDCGHLTSLERLCLGINHKGIT